MDRDELRSRLLSLIPADSKTLDEPLAIILQHNVNVTSKISLEDVVLISFTHEETISDLIRKYRTKHPASDQIALRLDGVTCNSADTTKTLLTPGSAILTLEAIHIVQHNLIMSPRNAFAHSDHGGDPLSKSQQDSQTSKLFSLSSKLLEELSDDRLSNWIRVLKKNGRGFVDKVGQMNLPELADPVERLNKLLNQPLESPTIIAFLGDMGIGKSTLINALLGEQRLAPTSGSQACTNVAVEYRYNYDLTVPYRTEIQFKTKAAAQDYVEVLLEDIKSVQDTSKSERDDGDRATLQEALSQLKVMGSSRAADSAVNSLRDKSVTQAAKDFISNTKFLRRLGKTLRITAKECEELYSKNKRFLSHTEGFWPMIEVVRIFTRSKVHSTGAVLVDLPGLKDRSSTRAGIGEDYLKRAKKLFICAAMKRAVDSTSTTELLDRSLRMHVHMDGNLDGITVVATGSDQADVDEVRELTGYGIEEQLDLHLAPLDAKLTELESQQTKLHEETRNLETEKKELTRERGELTSSLKDWKNCKKALDKGKVAFEPIETPTDLSMDEVLAEKPLKKRKKDDATIATSVQTRRILSMDQVVAKIEELEKKRKSVQSSITSVNGKKTRCSKRSEKDLAEIGTQISAARKKCLAACIPIQNRWCKEALSDLASKEQEDVGAVHQDSGDADAIPVYTVSAKAFLNLHSTRQGTQQVTGFPTEEATEIPQLQEHCMQAAAGVRSRVFKNFANEIFISFYDLEHWAAQGQMRRKDLTTDEQQEEQNTRKQCERDLLVDVRKRIVSATDQLRRDLEAHLYPKFDEGIEYIQERVPHIVGRWTRRLKSHATYKAVSKRQGVWQNRKAEPKHIDWPRDLTDPLIDFVHQPWVKTLADGPYNVFIELADSLAGKLELYHEKFRHRNKGFATAAELKWLHEQTLTYAAAARRLVMEAHQALSHQQQDLSRTFEPKIKATMRPAWSANAVEKGKGMFETMKGRNLDHAVASTPKMYEQMQATVKSGCTAMLRSAEGQLCLQLQEVVVKACAAHEGIKLESQASAGNGAGVEESEQYRNAVLSELFRIESELKYALDHKAFKDLEDDEQPQTKAVLDETQWIDLEDVPSAQGSDKDDREKQKEGGVKRKKTSGRGGDSDDAD